jgi:hypothetical protein
VDEVFGKDQNILDSIIEAILEERRKEGAESKDQEGEEAAKDEATEEGAGKKKQGLRDRVAEMVRVNSKLERKSSKKSMCRQPSKMFPAECPR